MPAKRKRKTRGWQRFWQDWGWFLAAAGIILMGLVVFQIVRTRPRELNASQMYDIYFTQGGQGAPMPDGLEAEIVADIDEAEERIDLATPGLDLQAVGAALVEAHGRGVQVRVLEDPARQGEPGVAAVTAQLQAAGIPVVLHPQEGGLGGSFLVVDRRVAWAGSWELTVRALEEDAHCVLRFTLAQLADDFRTEFEEMFEQQAFGPGSPDEPGHRFTTMLDGGIISVYFMPEDDPFQEVLTTLARSSNEFLVMTESLADFRLEDRFEADAPRFDIEGWGAFDAQGTSSEETFRSLQQAQMNVRVYQGPGRLRENVVVVDSAKYMVFSQPLEQAALDQKDGYVVVIQDPQMAKVLQFEFNRLYTAAQDLPQEGAAEE